MLITDYENAITINETRRPANKAENYNRHKNRRHFNKTIHAEFERTTKRKKQGQDKKDEK